MFNQNEEPLGFCSMIMQMLFSNIIYLSVKRISEMSPTQNILRYLPQHDQKTPGGINLYLIESIQNICGPFERIIRFIISLQPTERMHTKLSITIKRLRVIIKIKIYLQS